LREFNKDASHNTIITAGSNVHRDSPKKTGLRCFGGPRGSFEAGLGFIEKDSSFFDKILNRKKSVDCLHSNKSINTKDLINMKLSP